MVRAERSARTAKPSELSAAKPKIADYPFTTLVPNLGVVQLSDHRTFVVADIPGIIEGAHEGKGLGLQFLRHIERTRILAFLIPIDAMDWQAEYDQLRREIAEDSPGLAAYHALHATRADLLRRLGRSAEARAAYDRAIEATGNDAERAYLARRRASLADPL